MPKKITYEFVKEQIENEGCILKSTKYINSKRKLDYICPEGHKQSICWNHWQQGERCSSCYGNAKLTIEFIKSDFEEKGCHLLTEKYENSKQKLGYVCLNGHKHSVIWCAWQRGDRCPFCYGNAKPDINFIISDFEKIGCELLATEYVNSDTKLDYICQNSHKHSISWHNWQKGHRCPYCFSSISDGEMEVRNFVESLGIKVLANNRDQIFNPDTGRSLELDIFMPDLDKAVEYNGEYWHRDKDRDLLKQELCELKGINLLTIWDKEWKMQNGVCKNKIKKFLFTFFGV